MKPGKNKLKTHLGEMPRQVVHPASVRSLINASWDFAHTILWNDYRFGKAEIALCKRCIQEYYEEIPAEEFTATAYKHFTTYCERILLAKEYANRFSHYRIPHPCIWFHKMNPEGFAGTKALYIRNQKKHKHRQVCRSCPLKWTDFVFQRSGKPFSHPAFHSYPFTI